MTRSLISGSTTRLRRAPALLAAALLAAAPLAADVLVTVDGAQVDTRGPWEVKRGMVVFTNASGTLSSLRLSEVDLAASEAATAAANAPQPAAEAEAERPRRAVVATITDADIPRGTPQPAASADDAAAEGETAAAGEGEAAPPANPAAGVIVLDGWDTGGFAGFDGTQISGRVRNTSESTFAQVSIEVEALDRTDEVIGRGRAFLTSTTLPPGSSTTFRLPLSGIYEVDDIRIVARGTLINAFLEQSSDAPAADGSR